MAILTMKSIFIYGLKKDREQILEFLQRKGAIEVSDKLPEDIGFKRSDVSSTKQKLERNISLTRTALDILGSFAPSKGSITDVLKGKKEIEIEVVEQFSEKHEQTMNRVNRIIELNKQNAESHAEVLRLQAEVQMLTPWMELDIPMDFSGTKKTTAFIGTLPRPWTLEEIYESLAEYLPLDVEIISTTRDQTCIVVTCLKDKADAVGDELRRMEFAYPSITFNKAPCEQLEHLKNQISEAESSISKAQKEIISYEEYREDILFLQDYDTVLSERYEVIGHLLQNKNVFILSGYVPEKEAKNLEKELNEHFTIAVEIEQPSEEEDVPVLLKNSSFSAPLEGVVEGFSLPNKQEIDPTPIVSLFYYVLFGLMLSDAGYGALMVIVCGFSLAKYSHSMENSTKKALQMFLYCGIATVFWGIMFGSYFGDLLDVVSATFFGKKISIPPLWFFPVNEPMRMLTFSLIIGLVHLMTGLGLKFYQLLKLKDIKGIFYDVISWFVLVIGGTILLLSTEMVQGILGVNLTVPAVVADACAVLAIIAALVIILTNGRESRNPFKRFLKGAYALYGISGYLSDVLSYSRLLALGLATGVIASVINQMAAVAAGGVIGAIVFIVVVIGGHAVNIGINALGAYVHTNRLHYVEFFGKFYEGGGRKFMPYDMKTKYYKIKENVKNESR